MPPPQVTHPGLVGCRLEGRRERAACGSFRLRIFFCPTVLCPSCGDLVFIAQLEERARTRDAPDLHAD